MNYFTKSVIVAGLMAMGSPCWAYQDPAGNSIVPARDQVTGAVDVNGTAAPVKSQIAVRVNESPPVPVEQVRYRRYYRSPYGYGWRSYSYGQPYYYNNDYYGTPGAGYYDYGYGRGAVRVGPMQVWW